MDLYYIQCKNKKIINFFIKNKSNNKSVLYINVNLVVNGAILFYFIYYYFSNTITSNTCAPLSAS